MSLFLEDPKGIQSLIWICLMETVFTSPIPRNKISADKRNQCFLGVSIGVHMWENAFPVFGRNARVLKKKKNLKRASPRHLFLNYLE